MTLNFPKAKLVTLAPGLRPEQRFAALARGLAIVCCNNIAAEDTKLLRPCSYEQKLSRLARKHFEESTSEISPCYENNIKSYIVLSHSYETKLFPSTDILSIVIYKIMSQRETLPGKRDNIFPYEQNKII